MNDVCESNALFCMSNDIEIELVCALIYLGLRCVAHHPLIEGFGYAAK